MCNQEEGGTEGGRETGSQGALEAVIWGLCCQAPKARGDGTMQDGCTSVRVIAATVTMQLLIIATVPMQPLIIATVTMQPLIVATITMQLLIVATVTM